MTDALNEMFTVRPTGVLIEDNNLLLVKQKVNDSRGWSLPGGKLEHGESIKEGLIREVLEETGLNVDICELLYVCEKTDATPPLIHITFLIKRISGEIRLPTNEYESTPIYDVKMVDIDDLIDYGFSKKFIKIMTDGFPNRGSYVGAKATIGL